MGKRDEDKYGAIMRSLLEVAYNSIASVYSIEYADAHPELVGVLVQSMVKMEQDEVYRNVINYIGKGLVENVRSDHPLMGETLDGISEALREIAGAMKWNGGEDGVGMAILSLANTIRRNGKEDRKTAENGE